MASNFRPLGLCHSGKRKFGSRGGWAILPIPANSLVPAQWLSVAREEGRKKAFALSPAI